MVVQVDREIVTKALYMYKLELAATRDRFGGTLRFISQHAVLWGGQNPGQFSQGFWLGVCAGLSIEWLKADAAGNDFVERLQRMRDSIFTDPRSAGFAQFATEVEASHVQQNRLDAALVPPFRRNGPPVQSPFPFTSLGGLFKRGSHVYISSGSHAMAGKVGDSFFGNTITFYDPNVGELRDTKLDGVGRYLAAATQASMVVTGRDPSEAASKSITLQHFTV